MRNTLTDSETDELYRRYEKITEHKNVSREGLRIWYNGYHTFRGESVYNPRSVPQPHKSKFHVDFFFPLLYSYYKKSGSKTLPNELKIVDYYRIERIEYEENLTRKTVREL